MLQFYWMYANEFIFHHRINNFAILQNFKCKWAFDHIQRFVENRMEMVGLGIFDSFRWILINRNIGLASALES